MFLLVPSFVFFMLMFAGVGIIASHKSKKTSSDYLLASKEISPLLSGVSAMASKLSGYMFIGFIGFVYLKGIIGLWLILGLFFGDMLSFTLLTSKIKKLHNQYKSLSYEDLISQRTAGVYKKLRFILAILIVIFLGIYASAQLKAGSKALQVTLDWSANTGTLLCAFFVLFYCWSGGIRASIWTDAIQSVLMFFSSLGLIIYAVLYIGGWGSFVEGVQAIGPNYYTLFPTNLGGMDGLFYFVLGWVFMGFGVLGQPHIMARVMVLDNIKNLSKMRLYYYLSSFMIIVLLFFIALAARLLLANTEVIGFDPEMALPLLSLKLMPPVFVGAILAGIFASTMSTVDSQIISCSSAISQSLLPIKQWNYYYVGKIITVLLIIGATLIALFAPGNVFSMVLLSWSALGVAVGGAVLIQLFTPEMSERLAIFTILSSTALTIYLRLMQKSGVIPEAFFGFTMIFITLICYKAYELRQTLHH